MALYGCHDVHGRLPPSVVYAAYGKPLHSWRVLILPPLDRQELYEPFRLGEPRDSPHNLALLPRMPRPYAPPPGKAGRVPPPPPACHVLVGRGAAFEGARGPRLKEADFPDGLSNTLLLVGAGRRLP